ncbi:LytTR family DNA-binding domain-containing protein [Limnohabitans sp. Bal53]|uniref:LytR/AlgR family response regulator transcription factor n=1 Tax=Limnohabitans sp. Bal53 TaxID=1977910 RepID=UPI000D33FE69|nr:LytTR family DNA-binding domain-containing protein [Limnohabitans sp. Bal53]PUE42679.1 DNA-binding response regulator [Limnohabitans sp. Bal53]
MNIPYTALIAEDEPLLAQTLANELRALWPNIHIAATAGDGLSAVQLALQHRPDVLFFDIRMPGQSGLEAAAELAEEWPSDTPFPLLVFVTAYDQYAIQAFEAQAVDYVLKPVRAERLRQTVSRLQNALQQRAQHTPTADLQQDPVLAQLRALLNLRTETTHPQPPEAILPPLQLLQASVGKALRMVPVAEVLRLEAADKYVRVFTLGGSEVLLRTPLKELMQRLDAQIFWQIHRGSVVRASAIDSVTRDDTGRLSLRLKGHADTLAVSRLYAHLFKAM